MRPAVTVIPESFSPSRLLLPMGSTLATELQPTWVRWHALLTAPASGQAVQGAELARAQQAAEAIFSEKCRTLCLAGEARADVAAHEITRALIADGLLPRDPEGDFSDGRRLCAVVAVDRSGRWSVARLGRAAESIAVVFQAPSQPAGVLWLDEPGEAVELPGAAEPQAFVAFERRERMSEEELRGAFESLVERVRELLVPPGALGGLRLPIVALGQGLPLLESRLLETNQALAGLMTESQQALGVVNETVRPLVSELRGAVEESAGAFAAIERARKILEDSSEDARQQRALLLAEVATVGDRWSRATEGLEEHRLRAAQGMDDQLALVGQAAARLAETAGRVAELGSSLDGSLLVLRDMAGEVVEALERKSTGIEALLLQTESLEHAVHSAVDSVSATDGQLREQAKGLVEFRKTVAEFVRRLGEEITKAETMAATSSKMEEIAAGLEPLRAALAQTMVRVDQSAVGLLDSLHAKTRLFEGYLAESQALSGNLARAVASAAETEQSLRGRAEALEGTQQQLALAAAGLLTEVRESRAAAASWKQLVDDAGGGVRTHLEEHGKVRAQLALLDEAAQLGLRSLQETEQRLGKLLAQVDDRAIAVARITAGIEPSVARLTQSVDEAARLSEDVARFSLAAAEATRSVEAARARAPELEKAIAGFGAELAAMAGKANDNRVATDESRGRLTRAIEGLELAGSELLSSDRGVTALLTNAELARAQLAGSVGQIDSLVEGLRRREQEIGAMASASTLPDSEARIAEAAVRLEQLFDDNDGPVEACRDELGNVTEQLRAVGQRANATAREIDGVRDSLAQSVERLNQRLEELRGIDPQSIAAEQPSWARRMPVYAGLLFAGLATSTGLILHNLPKGVTVDPAAQRALVAATAASAPAPPPPAPAPAAMAAAPAPAAPSPFSDVERQRIAESLKAEIGAGTISLDDRGGVLRLVCSESALFTPTTAKVTAGGRKVLDAVIREIKAMPPRGILVSAFTDRTDRSSADKDMALTLDRAWHVGDYLGSQGVDKSQIGAAGYGELEPVFDNADETLRVKNRRVEITFLAPAPASSARANATGGPTPTSTAPVQKPPATPE